MGYKSFVLKLNLSIIVAAALCFAPFAPTCGLRAQTQRAQTQKESEQSLIFEEASEASGLKFRHFNGANGKLHLPEIMGAGAALFDYDADGDMDAYLAQGSTLEAGDDPHRTLFPWREKEEPRARLFRNDATKNENGVTTLRFTDVTEASGIRESGYGMGAIAGDVNNDGRVDLYVYNFGPNRLYMNNGDGTFTDATAKAGADDPRWSASASLFDYDRDGWLDLFVVNYAEFNAAKSPSCYAETTVKDYCGPRSFRAVGNRLLRNKGDGTFEDATARAGVEREFGHGLGVVAADFNDDGWTDLYVANDGDPNQLWINQRNGTFVNEALLAGAAVNRDGQPEAGMGVDAGDFNEDGTEDLFVTHLMDETHTLYVNLGKGEFEDRTREAGVGLPGSRLTGFGTLFFDYDNDSLLDILIVNGAVRLLRDLAGKGDPFPLGQPNQIYRNDGTGRYMEVSEKGGASFRLAEASRGAAFGDIDDDGDTDVLVTNNNGPARLFLNRVGNRKSWLGLRLLGAKTNRDMLGAKVEVVLSPKRVLRRRARTDGSYLSSHDPRVLVGLGDAKSVEVVRVRWPGGEVEEWKNPPLNQYLTLKEGSSSSKR